MPKKSKVQKTIEADQRENRKEQGFFDGRFVEKTIPDKKRKYKRKKIKKDENIEDV